MQFGQGGPGRPPRASNPFGLPWREEEVEVESRSSERPQPGKYISLSPSLLSISLSSWQKSEKWKAANFRFDDVSELL